MKILLITLLIVFAATLASASEAIDADTHIPPTTTTTTTTTTASTMSVPDSPISSAVEVAIEKISNSITNSFNFPNSVEIENKKFQIEYTINTNLSEYIEDLVKNLKPTYSAIVVIDNESGDILAAIGYEKKHNRFNYNLPFSSSHPAASLAKVITSAALLEQNEIDLETPLAFNGKTTTLKPRQLADISRSKKRRRYRAKTKYQSFTQAFASSNNPIFGKMAMKNLSGDFLKDMADRMGFNSNIMSDLTIPSSEYRLPRTPMRVAETAAGYNNFNTISPVHAAVLPSIVVNDGALKNPRLIKRIFTDDTELEIPELNKSQVMREEVAAELKQLMEATISIGTGRRGFSGMKSELLEKLDIGGKSGTFSGGSPYGKHDWFIAFAKPKESTFGKGISVAVMNINSKKRVRSSRIVRDIIEYYYKNIVSFYSDYSEQ